jgi:hypothetical protein
MMTEDQWATNAKVLLFQAAAILRVEADEWRARDAPDWNDRTKEQMLAMAAADDGLAQAIHRLLAAAP